MRAWTVSKNLLLQTTGIAACATFLVLNSPASAATVGPINITGATDNGSFCGVSGTTFIVGTTDDGSGNDRVQTGVEFQDETLNEVYVNRSVPVGQSSTLSVQGSFVPSGNRAREQRRLVVREADQQTTGNTGQGRGLIRSFVAIPRSVLISAGGLCAAGAPNSAPVANAGQDLSVLIGAAVTLDGSGTTDANGDPITYQWTQVSGPTVALTNSGSQTSGFVAPSFTQPTVLEFSLRATDVLGEFTVDLVQITVSPPNTAPTVDAGPDQSVSGGDTVTLAGSASDLDNDPLTTTWVQTGGAGVTLSDPNALNPTFTAPPRARDDQVLSFELRADDGTVISSDTVDITVAGNEAPNVVVSAAPTSGAGNSQFTLDGSGTSDPEGDQIVYIWTQTGGPTVTLDSPDAAITTFTAPPGGLGTNDTLTFQLTAVDTFDESNSETVSVTVLANQGPTADAGVDQDIAGSTTVTLDGTGSTDPDGDELIYTWTQVSGTNVTLSDPNVVTPSFLAPAATGQAQILEFELEVQDRAPSGSARLAVGPGVDTDRVVVTILANRPPVANAGPAQGPINGGETVTLDGSGSTDPDGDTLTYTWEQIAGTTVALSDSNAVQPTFTAPNANETLAFRLTVSDGQASATSVVEIAVQAVGSITLVQRITGSDTQVSFSSDVAVLTGNVSTTNGVGQITAQNVPTGVYTVTAGDLSAQGIAITDITCSDDDSTGDTAARSATIDLAAGEDVTCTFTAVNSREAAQVAIYNFLTGRNALLLANQPDLQRRIDRLSDVGASQQGSLNAYGVPVPGAQHLPFEATVMPGQSRFSSNLAMALGPDKDRSFDIWTEAYFGDVSIGAQDASFSIVHIGADLKLSDSVLIGAILQLDDLRDRDRLEAGEAEGDGFLAGPYITAKLAPQLFIEARAAWGSSDNVVSPIEGQRDAFDTSRSLYSGSLVGQLELGKRTVLRPELTLRYLTEDQKGYTDSLGIAIPSQTVDQGDLSFRPRLSHSIDTRGGAKLRPFAEIEGIYTFGTEPDAALANLVGGTFADTFGELRARVAGGVDFMGKGNFRASLSGFYDGIGAEGFSNQGVQIGVSFGF